MEVSYHLLKEMFKVAEFHRVAEERIAVRGGVVRGKVGRCPGAGGKATKLRPPLRRGGGCRKRGGIVSGR